MQNTLHFLLVHVLVLSVGPPYILKEIIVLRDRMHGPPDRVAPSVLPTDFLNQLSPAAVVHSKNKFFRKLRIRSASVHRIRIESAPSALSSLLRVILHGGQIHDLADQGISQSEEPAKFLPVFHEDSTLQRFQQILIFSDLLFNTSHVPDRRSADSHVRGDFRKDLPGVTAGVRTLSVSGKIISRELIIALKLIIASELIFTSELVFTSKLIIASEVIIVSGLINASNLIIRIRLYEDSIRKPAKTIQRLFGQTDSGTLIIIFLPAYSYILRGTGAADLACVERRSARSVHTVASGSLTRSASPPLLCCAQSAISSGSAARSTPLSR